ncbi:MAG: fibronectin type III domain-containing protein [Opitutales bacterium]|nr:fibronectin type III domain-containing protein [Opitutales bacterium]
MRLSLPDRRIRAFLAAMVTAPSLFASGGAAQIWDDFATAPHTHPNIPHNAYAGYRGGAAPIPDVPVVADLLDFGGNGDGETDNTAAFQRAIEAAWRAGGGAVYIPPGVYVVDKMIHLNQSGVVLRGAGPEATTIRFPNDLDHAIGTFIDGNGNTHWFWQGGLLWMGPAAQLRRDFRLNTSHEGANMGVDTGTWWPEAPANLGFIGKRVAEVTGDHPEGAFTLEVDDASHLREGAYFRLVYKNAAASGDYDLYKDMVGHPLMHTFNWAGAGAMNSRHQWVWPVRIARIEGNLVTLDQPLRLRTRAKWEVAFETMGEIISESGVEDLTIELTSAPNLPDAHSHDVRHNALYLTKTVNCWVRNVDIVNAQNGIMTRSTKHIELRDVRILGDVRLHHGISVVRGHDNLITDFVMEPRISHGISIEDMASGNVFRRGNMGLGTDSGGGSFDSHRYMSFDILRTDIHVLNSIGRPGGNNNTGPLVGRRVVHWNIRGNTGDNNGEWVNHPDAHSSGALVGVHGPRFNGAAWGMVPGDKGNIIADEGVVPVYPDLYDKQIELRKATEAWAEIVSPHLDLVAPGSLTLEAAVNPGAADLQSVTFVVDGSPLHTVTEAPFTAAWEPTKGVYEVTVVAETSAGTVTSAARQIVIGHRDVIEDGDPRLVYTGAKTVFTNADASGGTYTQFRAADNAYVTLNFRGTRFMIFVHNLQPTQQRMEIFLNDLNNPVTLVSPTRLTEPRYLAYDSGLLPEGNHTVRIRPPSHQVLLDYIVIENTGEFAGGGLPDLPIAPSDLIVTGTTHERIDLAWTDNATNELGFKIERSATGTSGWAEIATVPAGTNAFSDTGLPPSSTHHYRVRAYNADGDSPYTNTVSATTLEDTGPPEPPAAPASLTATAVNASRIHLQWADHAHNEDGFALERAPHADGPWSEVALLSANTTAHNDTGLSAETTYHYRLRAFNEVGFSAYSGTATATTLEAGAGPLFVFYDDFADNDRTVDPAWFSIGPPAGVVINQADGVLSLGRTASNSHTYLASNWSGISLDVGDELAFSFTVKLTGNQGNRDNEFMFGIGNNNGTLPTADGQSVFADDFGYVAAVGAGTGTAGLFRDAGADNWLGRFPGGDHTLIESGAAALAITDTFKTYTLTLTRTPEGIDLVFTDGTTVVTASDNNVPHDGFHTFNTVTFGYYNRNTANFLDVSGVSVTYTPALPAGPPATFAGWIDQYDGIPAAERGQLGMPAADGIVNLLKYALGLGPLDDATPRLPLHWTESSEGETHLYLSYARLAGGTEHGDHLYEIHDLVYKIAVSTDLTEWSVPGPGDTALVERVAPPQPDPHDPAVEHITLRLQSPLAYPGEPRAFLRLAVETKDD